MTQTQIKEKADAVRARLKEFDAKAKARRKAIVAKLHYLQDMCEHPNMQHSSDSGWGRMPSSYQDCPDCGYHRSY